MCTGAERTCRLGKHQAGNGRVLPATETTGTPLSSLALSALLFFSLSRLRFLQDPMGNPTGKSLPSLTLKGLLKIEGYNGWIPKTHMLKS